MKPTPYEIYLAQTLAPNPCTNDIARLLAEYREALVRACPETTNQDVCYEMVCPECEAYIDVEPSVDLDLRDAVKDAILALR